MNEVTETPPQLLNGKIEFDFPNEIVVINESEEESPMTDEAVHYFLDEILKKKKDLHDPRHRCNRFFGDIRKILLIQHGLLFSVKTLERKYHYLKRHFDSLCQNKKRNYVNPKGALNWPFFEKMMEIFAEELAIEDAPTMASLYPDPPLPKSALHIPHGLREKFKYSSRPQEHETPPEESYEEKPKETTWNHTVVLEFLNECVKKKSEFWDPTCSRQEILVDIQNAMTQKGYFFKLESLDRKLKNFKTCYHIRTLRSKENSRTQHNKWPYFAQLHELYNGFRDHKIARKSRRTIKKNEVGVRRRLVRKSTSMLTRKKRKLSKCDENHINTTSMLVSPLKIKPDPFEQCHLPEAHASQLSFDGNQAMEEDFADPENSDFQILDDKLGSLEEDLDIKTDHCNKTSEIDVTDDFQFAKKLLALEERRTIATEQLLEELKESNRIRKKKLDFTQQKLSYLKSRAKRRDLV